MITKRQTSESVYGLLRQSCRTPKALAMQRKTRFIVLELALPMTTSRQTPLISS